MNPGEQWRDGLHNGLAGAGLVLLLVSPRSLELIGKNAMERREDMARSFFFSLRDRSICTIDCSIARSLFLRKASTTIKLLIFNV